MAKKKLPPPTTFEQWWATVSLDEFTAIGKDVAMQGWNAAAAAEREACAKICADKWNTFSAAAGECQDAIQKRSNVELTGAAAPLAQRPATEGSEG